MYEVLTLNELHKNVSIMYQYKGISVKVMYFGHLYLSPRTSWRDMQYGVPLIHL
jgi:hypothetical protein